MATALSMLVALSLALLVSQERAPDVRDAAPDPIRVGAALFQTRCADCHGTDAKGVVGPDLTVLWTLPNVTDDRLFQTVRRGVPGTSMPASTAPAEEIRAILAYLHTLTPTVPGVAQGGDASHGEQVFQTRCSTCHAVNGRGGHLGPDLSRIGSLRSREALARKVRLGSAPTARDYPSITLVMPDGRRIRGTRKGEDASSIQIMDTREHLQGYLKADVREVINETRSLMPDFASDRLSDSELTDLVQFLSALRGAPSAQR